MSVLQRTIRMFVMAAMAVAGPIAFSQEGYHPSAEPLRFDPDWQFFAPVQLQDLEDLSGRQRANTGFYFTLDRMHIGVTRPETEQASHQMDFTWGSRFDFGWMKDDEKGWSFSAMTISGPNHYNQFEQNRANAFVATTAAGFEERLYLLQDSVNVGSFASFDANKVWRLEPYRYGGILEPMIGMRYAFFGDTAHNDTYNVLFPVANQFGTVTAETLTRDDVQTRNHMLLGQLGFRYTKFARRWTFSNDAKVFAGHVYQSQETKIETVTNYLTVPPIAAGSAPTAINDRQGTGFAGRRNSESTLGFDIRVESAYKATKNIDLRAGFQMLYFGRGIWRGSTVTEAGNQFSNNQHLIMPGFTFGVAINR